MNVTNGQA
jgi:polyamine oxidase